MDKIDETREFGKAMSPDGTNAAGEEFRSRCICARCPTYAGCAKDAGELLFCATGKSNRGSSFGSPCACPVAGELGLFGISFCTRVAGKARLYEQTVWGTTLV